VAAFWAVQAVVSACGHSPSTAAGNGPNAPVAHIVVIVMENREYGSIIGSPSAPYVNALAKRSVLLTGYDAITHPSLPNYIAMTAGGTYGINSDCFSCMITARNLVDQLELAHVSWKGYMESMPRACYWGDAYPYAQKHNPFIHYTDIKDNRTRCGKIVPFTQLAADEHNNALPQFAFITPNLCHDMHDCSVKTGDAWLSSVVPALLSHLGANGIVVITFDEGSTNAGCCFFAAGGHVVTLIAGPGARMGVRLNHPVDHYSLLRLIEGNWSLRRLRHAGCVCTPAIAGWRA
jgi:phospholipase C